MGNDNLTEIVNSKALAQFLRGVGKQTIRAFATSVKEGVRDAALEFAREVRAEEAKFNPVERYIDTVVIYDAIAQKDMVGPHSREFGEILGDYATSLGYNLSESTDNVRNGLVLNFQRARKEATVAHLIGSPGLWFMMDNHRYFLYDGNLVGTEPVIERVAKSCDITGVEVQTNLITTIKGFRVARFQTPSEFRDRIDETYDIELGSTYGNPQLVISPKS